MTTVKRRLDDYLEDLPLTLPQGARPDVVLDSESDTSDVDEPKAIPPPSAGPSRARPIEQTQNTMGPGGSRSSFAGRQQGPLHPKAAMQSNVQAVVGRGGKLQYEVASSPQDGSYYAVQW
jgi:DNA repair and recombination protein RAD54B